ncbi:uncharacterized protein LOC110036036, partial [Phalaenopsis equestris]|uniref:uncharacterized protein LOC110036036 n=1 Tax=Phalaenopsis equestris TaxID=78828 RepID=UPI0009E2E204
VRRHYGRHSFKFDDLKELINCSLIRTYIQYREEFIFLRPRPQLKVSRRKNICAFCGNGLNYNYRYCSLSCKVEHVRLEENDISSILLQFDASQTRLTESENLQTNVDDQPNEEVVDGDHNQITPNLAPIDTEIDVEPDEGSSSGWSISEIFASSDDE